MPDVELTEAEIADLRVWGEDLSQRVNALHEPRYVALAFASPLEGELRFTMQTWIDLEAVRSPLLRGENLTTREQVYFAGRAFGLEITENTVTAEEAGRCLEAMREAIEAGFAMSLKMNPPKGSELGDGQGFGNWLPIHACLVKECGLDPEAALRMNVGRAFALLAAVRHNQGWDVGGKTYALRDAVGNDDAEQFP